VRIGEVEHWGETERIRTHDGRQKRQPKESNILLTSVYVIDTDRN
jgi:hypothetical protein